MAAALEMTEAEADMAQTKSFKELVQRRVTRDAAFVRQYKKCR